jgi:4-aminobutyrate---pyruvate transaminase
VRPGRCAPRYYRCHEEGESEEEFATRMADALKALILAEGPDTVAAFIAEPVMARHSAAHDPFREDPGGAQETPDAVHRWRSDLRFGRTGKMWGSQTFDLEPDMITRAKALSAAMQPLSALLVNEKDPPGDARRESQTRQFRLRLHLLSNGKQSGPQIGME